MTGALESWLDGRREAKVAQVGPVVPAEAKEGAPQALSPAAAAAFRMERMDPVLGAATVAEVSPELQPLKLAHDYFRAGKYDNAGVELKKLLLRDPTDFVTLCFLANVRFHQEEREQALEYAEKAVARAPSDGESVAILAQILAFDRGKEKLKRAETLLQGLPVGALNDNRRSILLARVQAMQGRGEDALVTLEKALRGNPTHPGILENLAKIQLALGRLEQALASSRALLSPPNSPDMNRLFLQALCLRRLDRYRESYAVLRKMRDGDREAYERFALQHGGVASLDRFISIAESEARLGERADYLTDELSGIIQRDPLPERRERALQHLFRRKRLSRLETILALKALSDGEGSVRLQAYKVIVQHRRAIPDGFARLVRGLGDTYPQVRGFTARILGLSKHRELLPTLLGALDKEEDGYAFNCLHEALGTLSGKQVFLMSGSEDDPETRKGIRKEWKEQLKQ